MKKVSRDTPLSELTLRKYEKPGNVRDRELAKKICLSLGLLQPGDSRDVVTDVLLVLLKAKQKKEWLTSSEIEGRVISSRKRYRAQLAGIASSNIRRQIKRIRALLLVEKLKNHYRIVEFDSLRKLFAEKVELFLLNSILSRVNEYLDEADKVFSAKRKKKKKR
ncbi:hypothetical protein J4475_00365 [Candidatus Woesearchaeota archaeon]|nr:hypothetical protein [Candidatus Woesearchaeota archaeon]